MAATEEGVLIQDLEVTHDRQVTPSAGSVQVGRWTYPTRVFDGVAEYQTRGGDWVPVPADGPAPEDDEPPTGDGTP